MTKSASPVQKDAIDQLESFYTEMTANAVKLAKDTLDYSVSVATGWRKLGMDAAKKAIERFDTTAA